MSDAQQNDPQQPQDAPEPPQTGGPVADVRDGGQKTLRLSQAVAGEVVVTDLTTGRVCDPAEYEVQKQSVRRARGVWARGRGRWAVEHGGK